MSAARRLVAQRFLAALICAAALLLRLLVPSGYMIGSDQGHIGITICSGMAGDAMPAAMSAHAGDMRHHGKEGDGREGHGKGDMPCPFASLTAPAMGGADVVLLAALLAFVTANGLRHGSLPPLVRRPHVRPPLRGPPARL